MLAALVALAVAVAVSYDRLSPSAPSAGRPVPAGTVARGNVPILTQDRLRHIELRHWPGSSARGAGKFAQGTTPGSLKAMIDEAVLLGRARRDSQGRPGVVYERDLGHTIGVDIDGRPASRLRVVVGADNHVITAFPY